ncbi:prepilin-type N-terminal cleavage/methylation domain-containing protein [Peptoniphilus asaccharolyticus DSM 20463]|uniref:Prepilin-type N-terminal cleavage/methylation domain-containing protein n=1 Tax=Peptoniphilus asaccharolyticus DSM 20463 TaxID=573058 RepID=A0A1W1UMX2_PEPAS|nr:prepilin-type N-terminal cleavage/methylation domain-containing protein [Peptoniphilus asaccharolyticus]MBL7574931.1 prepilin-type N-terminal cleavage/methylation domain-containing protein [Peptoniphilus asaccharolyticus]SMB82373.1 prepilin-type N-terminal cleavage/methylation domain-containing protein [Peptoniphilus asaccharolyticus DSM 20463]
MKRGFTLIELVVVLGIVVILFSVGLSSIRGVNSYKQKIAVKNFIADLNVARGFAISNNSEITVKITPTSYEYDLNGEKFFKELPNGLELVPETKDFKDIVFTRRGVSSNEAGRTIDFRTDKKTYTVTIAPVTGKVRIK